MKKNITIILYIIISISKLSSQDIYYDPIERGDTVRLIIEDRLSTNPFAMDLQTAVPNYHVIDQSKSVGVIPFEQTMDNGALIYSVPIQAYPGSNQTQPNISLTYNSLSKEGIAGYGWNIGGLSTISIVNYNEYFDRHTDESKMDKTGAYALDGTRLINLEQTDKIIKYESEKGRILVTAHLSGNIIKYFDVRYPNGNTATYGYSTNTKGQLFYPMTRMQDMLGNYIDYKYQQHDNIYYVEEVSYGTSKAIIGKVIFSYLDLKTSPKLYLNGATVSYRKYLNKIDTYFNTQKLQTIALTHDYGTYPFLKQIDCINDKNESLNPLIFYYGDGNNSSDYQISEFNAPFINNPNFEISKFPMFRANFSSQNLGVVIYPNSESRYGEIPVATGNFERSWKFGSRVYESPYTDKELLVYYDFLKNEDSQKSENLVKVGFGFIDAIATDIDGDGIDELIRINTDNCDHGPTENISYNVFRIKDKESTLVNSIKVPYKESVSKPYYSGSSNMPSGVLHSPIMRRHIAGDFLGNGKNQVLSISVNEAYGRSKHNSQLNMICFTVGKSIYNTLFDLNTDDILFVMDYNGDGKADLVKINGRMMSVYTFNQLKDGKVEIQTLVKDYELISEKSTTRLDQTDFVIGDINGDGKTDILIRPFDGSKNWTVLYSTNTDEKIKREIVAICAHVAGTRYYLHDLNNDGFLDLVKIKDEAIISNYMGVSGGFNTEEQKVYSLDSKTYLIPTNIFQKDNSNILFGASLHKFTSIMTSQNKSKDYLLTGVINSLGVINKHYYEQMNNSSVYIPTDMMPSDNPMYPYPLRVHTGGDMYLLQKSDQYHNKMRFSGVEYKYIGAISHLTKKKFLCFNYIISTDKIALDVEDKTFSPYIGNMPTVIRSNSGKIYNSYFSTTDPDTKINQTFLTSQMKEDIATGVSEITSYDDYDDYGNLVQTKRWLREGVTDGLVTTGTYTYNNHISDNRYQLGELRTQTTSKDGVTSKNTFEYNSLGQISSSQNFYNDNLVDEKSYIYTEDAKEVKEKKYSSEKWLSKEYKYDNLNRLEKEIDMINNYVEYHYDPIYGQLESKIDHKKNKVEYKYDNWRKIQEITTSDGIISKQVSSWIDPSYNNYRNNTNDERYQVVDTSTGSPTSYTNYDVLGRVVVSGIEKLDETTKGSYIQYTQNVYNEKGLLQQTSLPYKASSEALWTKYSYDKYNRLLTIKGKGENLIESLYYAPISNLSEYYKVTSHSRGLLKVKYYNGEGQIKIIEQSGDDENKIIFDYNIDGQLASTSILDKISKALITSIKYDKFGRQEEIKDPSLGIKSITYDNDGNIKQETDAKGNITFNQYDPFNRLEQSTTKSKDGKEKYTTTYKYNEDGLVEKVSGGDLDSTIIHYDYYDNLSLKSVKEAISDENWFEKTYSYNKGNLTSIVYNSNTEYIGTESFSYDDKGFMTEKLFNGVSYWKLEALNGLDLPIEVRSDKILREYKYDSYGVMENRKVSQSLFTVLDQEYQFDKITANLDLRTDKINKITESFRYDPLHRLTKNSSKNIVYDFKGNIMEKSDVGIFHYDENLPYAVSEINAMKNTIPLRVQSISYNSLTRPATIQENNCLATFNYNGGGERTKMTLHKNDTLQLTKYYIGNQYESQSGLAGNKELLYLGGDPYSASSVYVKENGEWNMYHICRDYLGSITHILDSDGNIKQELSYDAWGRLRNPINHLAYETDHEPELFLGRGYTGHEHLTSFGLINMNARLYDPLLGRFLSPDLDLKDPEMLQNYNKYSYALNNPLKYTDPDGENPFLAWGLGALFGYVANGYNTGNWGWNSVWSGAFTAAGLAAGYTTSGQNNPWTYSAQFVGNMFSQSLNFGSNFSISIYPYSLLTSGIDKNAGNGYALGVGTSLKYDNGKTSFSIHGIASYLNGQFEGKYSAGGGYNGYQYFLNYYSGRDNQFTGTVNIQRGKFGVRWENDAFANPFVGQRDRFRSNAVEASWGNYVVGTNVYTTDPIGYDKINKTFKDEENGSRIFIQGKNGTYKKGSQLSSALYIAYKSKGQITRAGINAGWVGDFFQNGFHHLRLPFIVAGLKVMKAGHFKRGDYLSPYYQSGTDIPSILY